MHDVGRHRPTLLRLYVLLGIMLFFWALNFVVAKYVVSEIPAPLVACLRMSFAAVFILPIYWWKSRQSGFRGWTRSDVPTLAMLGILGVAMNQGFFVLGISHTTVAHAAILMGTMPMLVLMMAAATGQQRLSFGELIGMLVALAGIAILQWSRSAGDGPSPLGDLLIFASAVAFAIFTVAGKKVSVSHGSVTINTFAYVGGALVALPATAWMLAGFHPARVSAAAWLGVIFMALFPSVICYLIYSYALGYIPASRVSAVTYLQPVLATAMGIVLLGERPGASLATGGALVLLGVFITERT